MKMRWVDARFKAGLGLPAQTIAAQFPRLALDAYCLGAFTANNKGGQWALRIPMITKLSFPESIRTPHFLSPVLRLPKCVR